MTQVYDNTKAAATQSPTKWIDILFFLAWPMMASAMIVESDSYRYATIFLAAIVLVFYRSYVVILSRHWLAILCYTWGAYVFFRFSYGILFKSERGTSEWLYIFPIFFPLVGVALYVIGKRLYTAATILIIIGTIGLLATIDFSTLLLGERTAPLWHNNPIHSGVGCGMFFLCSLFWTFYSLEVRKMQNRSKLLTIAIGTVAATLSLLGVLGAQSKGAWLGLAATAIFLTLVGLYLFGGKWRLPTLVVATTLSAMIGSLAYPYVQRVAGPTIDAVAKVIRVGVSEQSFLVAIQTSIDDPTTPSSMGERLKLISNAIEVYRDSPLIGSGNLWLTRWKQTNHSDVSYTIIHNGYLEVLVRHGLLGMTVMGILILTAVWTVNFSYRRGHISASLAGFIYSISFLFFSTIATNSNNRLALGESFFLLAGGGVFALILSEMLKQTQGIGKTKPQDRDENVLGQLDEQATAKLLI